MHSWGLRKQVNSFVQISGHLSKTRVRFAFYGYQNSFTSHIVEKYYKEQDTQKQSEKKGKFILHEQGKSYQL